MKITTEEEKSCYTVSGEITNIQSISQFLPDGRELIYISNCPTLFIITPPK